MSETLTKAKDEPTVENAAIEFDVVDLMGKIKAYVDKHGGAQFYALAKDVPGFIAPPGHIRCLLSYGGKVVWSDITPTAGDAVRALFKLRWVSVEATYGDLRHWTLRPADYGGAVVIHGDIPFTTSSVRLLRQGDELRQHPTSSEPYVQLHDDAARYFCPKCQCPASFERAELLFCEQKEMSMVQVAIHEDSSVSEKEVEGDAGDDNNEPGLTFTLFLNCVFCKQQQIHEMRVWDPRA